MVLLLASNHWAGSILESSGGSSALNVPFRIGKWIFFGCIIFSFLLLAWEAKKSRAIIRSRDISYAFTNVMANNYYSMKSYDHFCFFSQINNSKKKKDDFAFFVFFTFKGWKRLLLTDAPRQVINAMTLYSFARSVHFTTDISKWYDGSFAKASVLLSMAFTVTIFIGSFILLMAAAFLYVPLLCYIQGNLKEYCCHKVDKRIAELMKRKNRKRLAKEAALMRKEAMGDYSHLKDKKGHFKAAPLPQPTLPQIGLHELISDNKSERAGTAPSLRSVPRAAAYAYPPSTGHHYPISNPNGNIGMGYHGMNRWPNDREYNEKPGYAESVASTDRFVSHQAPPIGSALGPNGQAYGTHQVQHEFHRLAHQFPPPVDSQPLNRAPSYSSQDQRYYTDDKYTASYAVPTRSTAATSEYGGYTNEPPLPLNHYPTGAGPDGSEYGDPSLHDQRDLFEATYNPPIPLGHRFDHAEDAPPFIDKEIMELYGQSERENFDEAYESSNYSSSAVAQNPSKSTNYHQPR